MSNEGFAVPPPRLVLFDAVGTLLHPEPNVGDAYRTAGQRYGSERDAATIRVRFREALERYAGRVLLPADGTEPGPRELAWRGTTDETRERQRWLRIVAYVFDDVPQHSHAIFDLLWEHFADGRHWSLDPQIATTWKALEQRGYELGIASNFDARLLSVCRAYPPLDRSRHLYYSSQLGFVKPDPRFYEAIERRSGYRGSEILLIGDDWLHDYEAPRAWGWQTLLLDPADSAPVAPAARLAALSDVLSLL